MRCLVRYITRKRSGLTHEDKPHTGDQITIGRAASHQIFLTDLRVALNQARITQTPDGKFQIQATALSGVRINGVTTGMGNIAIGDVVSIGACRIEVAKPEGDFDLVLEVEQPKTGADDAATLASRSSIGLENTKLSKRGASWALFLVIFAIFFVAPVTGFMIEELRSPLRATGLLSDASWDTGRLANVHQTIGDDCNACHVKAFVMVEDDACVACHKETPMHADPVNHPVEQLTDTRCGTCHKEHNAPSSLSRLNDPLCVDCHGAIGDFDPKTTLLDVTHFENDHPQFKPTLFEGDGSGKTKRVSVDDTANLKERSGLRFNHKVHLAKGGINAPEGKRNLGCGACHQLEPGGAGLAPVSFETMCQDCHKLQFDPNDADRTVPHANVAGVINMLGEYYASVALKGGYEGDAAWSDTPKTDSGATRTAKDPATPDLVRDRRRPGAEMTVAERKVALDWANEKWNYVAEEIFEFRACTTCHVISRNATDEPSWNLEPVNVADRWMPKGLFPHNRHRTSTCESCHAANDSEVSEDVLMPGIASCTVCHGGPDERNKLASQCVDCHNFHILKDHFMGPAAIPMAKQ
jgi:predicted CXXCH cytochrome family protein